MATGPGVHSQSRGDEKVGKKPEGKDEHTKIPLDDSQQWTTSSRYVVAANLPFVQLCTDDYLPLPRTLLTRRS